MSVAKILINICDNWDYIKIILGYIVSIVLFVLGIKNKSGAYKTMSIVLAIVFTLFFIAKKLNL